jgi:hypothetical protein
MKRSAIREAFIVVLLRDVEKSQCEFFAARSIRKCVSVLLLFFQSEQPSFAIDRINVEDIFQHVHDDDKDENSSNGQNGDEGK